MRRFAIRCPIAITASPTCVMVPRIVMACEAARPTCGEMLTFVCEKSCIKCNPVPALPMTCPATASSTDMERVIKVVDWVEGFG